jgi:hypothetical protein
MMRSRIHAVAGIAGLVTILTFWSATVISEAFATHETIAAVKAGILRGMLILIPALMITGATGMSLGTRRTDVRVLAKKRRMPLIALNGLLILVPSAFYLSWKANGGVFDAPFYGVQAVELLAGAINIALMALNARDGLRLSGRIGKASPWRT